MNTTHRPRLRVRNINVSGIGDMSVKAMSRIRFADIGANFAGQFYVANYGGGDLRVIDAYLMFWAAKFPLPMERPYEGEEGNLMVSGVWLTPGRSDAVMFDVPLRSDDRHEEQMIDPAETAIYAMGWVEYIDKTEHIRRSAFCRRYDPAQWRFTLWDDAGLDYENEE